MMLRIVNLPISKVDVTGGKLSTQCYESQIFDVFLTVFCTFIAFNCMIRAAKSLDVRR